MAETTSKRIDDGFLRKVVWTLIALIIAQWLGVGIAFGMYAQQVTDNTNFRKSIGSVQDIAKSVSEELTRNYMTRDSVEQAIDNARHDLLNEQRGILEPINKQLEDMKQDIKYLVRREISKGDKKHE